MGEATNKLMGKTKRTVGRASGDRDLEGEGRMQETTGKVQGGVRKAGRKVNRGIDKVARKAGETRRKRTARPKARTGVGRGTGTASARRRRTTTTRTTERGSY